MLLRFDSFIKQSPLVPPGPHPGDNQDNQGHHSAEPSLPRERPADDSAGAAGGRQPRLPR